MQVRKETAAQLQSFRPFRSAGETYLQRTGDYQLYKNGDYHD
jgi:hypothetical protein